MLGARARSVRRRGAEGGVSGDAQGADARGRGFILVWTLDRLSYSATPNSLKEIWRQSAQQQKENLENLVNPLRAVLVLLGPTANSRAAQSIGLRNPKYSHEP